MNMLMARYSQRHGKIGVCLGGGMVDTTDLEN